MTNEEMTNKEIRFKVKERKRYDELITVEEKKERSSIICIALFGLLANVMPYCKDSLNIIYNRMDGIIILLGMAFSFVAINELPSLIKAICEKTIYKNEIGKIDAYFESLGLSDEAIGIIEKEQELEEIKGMRK